MLQQCDREKEPSSLIRRKLGERENVFIQGEERLKSLAMKISLEKCVVRANDHVNLTKMLPLYCYIVYGCQLYFV